MFDLFPFSKLSDIFETSLVAALAFFPILDIAFAVSSIVVAFPPLIDFTALDNSLTSAATPVRLVALPIAAESPLIAPANAVILVICPSDGALFPNSLSPSANVLNCVVSMPFMAFDNTSTALASFSIFVKAV